MASVGEFAGLWAILVPPDESGATLFVFGKAPLAMDGPRWRLGMSFIGATLDVGITLPCGGKGC